MWIAETEAWGLCLRHNLNDLETLEWVPLSHILSSVRLCPLPDAWSWMLEPSSSFSVKSLMDDLAGMVEPRDLYSIIWKDRYPKKCKKKFLWKLSLGAIDTVDLLIDYIVRYRLCLFLPLGVSCAIVTMSPHLISFASRFWRHILEAFGWSLTWPNTIFDLLASFC